MSTQEKEWGLITEFKSSADIYHAAEQLRDSGFKKFECYTPFPIHGMDDAMGLKATKLPWLILVCGLTGLATATGLQVITNMDLYPMIIGGKPNGVGSIVAFLPVMFELSVLFSAFGAVFGMIGINGLPKLYNPVFKHEAFKKVTDDGFFVVVSVDDPKYNTQKTTEFLEKIGGKDVTVIND